MNVQELNQLARPDFVATLGQVVEHSPWVAEVLWDQHLPFGDLKALHQALVSVVDAAGPAAWRAILQAHPELSGKEAAAGNLTEFSKAEQSSLGLDRLPSSEFQRMGEFNRRYREKFGFPFVVCVRLLKDRAELFALQARRYDHPAEAELRTGIAQVYEIARLRLENILLTPMVGA